MHRRSFIKTACIGTASAGLTFSARAKDASERPNILIIYVDDHVSESIRAGALAPNIKSLGQDGIYFSRAYTSAAACTPARYSCLTGRYAGRCKGRFLSGGITKEGQTWIGWNTNTDPGDTMGAKVLRDAGYATGIVGKLGCFGIEDAGNSNMFNEGDPNDAAKKAEFTKHQKVLIDGVKDFGFDYGGALFTSNMGPDQRHNPEFQTRCCLDFIEASKDRPFYLHFVPHLMHMPSPLMSLKSDPKSVYGIMLDEAPNVQPSRESVLKRVAEAGLDEKLAPATWLDDSVGALLNKLDELKIAGNTLVMFMQDNGHHGGKGSCYEGGVNVLGCWMRWPKGIAKPGRTNNSLMQNIDLIPTAFDACGVAPPDDYVIDGISLLPILKNEKQKLRDSLFCEIGHTRAVVTERWKYLAFRVPPSHEISPETRSKYIELSKTDTTLDPLGRVTHIHRQLGGCNTDRTTIVDHPRHFFDPDQVYDLDKDPGEQDNLAVNPEYAKQLSEMQQLLREHMMKAPGTFGEFKTFDDMPAREREAWRFVSTGEIGDGPNVNTKALEQAHKKKQ